MCHFQYVKPHLESLCSNSGTTFHETYLKKYLVSAYFVLGIVLGARRDAKFPENSDFVTVSPVPRIIPAAH